MCHSRMVCVKCVWIRKRMLNDTFVYFFAFCLSLNAIISFRSKYKIQIVCRVDGIIDICIWGHDQFFVGQHLSQCIFIRITVQSQFEHGIFYHLWRSLIIAQHYWFVQHDAIQFHVVRFIGHPNDIKIGRWIFMRWILLMWWHRLIIMAAAIRTGAVIQRCRRIVDGCRMICGFC